MDISAARETFTTFRIEGDPQILLSIIIKKGGTQFLYCQSRVKTNESALNLQFLTQHSEVVQPFKIGFYEYLLQKKQQNIGMRSTACARVSPLSTTPNMKPMPSSWTVKSAFMNNSHPVFSQLRPPNNLRRLIIVCSSSNCTRHLRVDMNVLNRFFLDWPRSKLVTLKAVSRIILTAAVSLSHTCSI